MILGVWVLYREFYVGGVLLLGWGLILTVTIAVFRVRYIWDCWHLLRNGIPAVGTILKVHTITKAKRYGGISYGIEYEFQSPQGPTLQSSTEMTLEEFQAVRLGDRSTATVLYDVQNPERNSLYCDMRDVVQIVK